MTKTPDVLARARAWTYHRQRLGRAAASADEALRDVVAVYSFHPTAPLALLARTKRFDAKDLAAMEEQKQALRLPAMRRSIFLVPAENAARLFTTGHDPVERHQRNLTWAGLDWDEYARLKEAVLAFAREPVDAKVLQAAIPTSGKLMTAVRIMCYEGLMLRVGGSSLRKGDFDYVATDAWLGKPLDQPDPDAALAWLAGEYLRGYGPARVADFAWWTGTNKRRATAAMATVETVDVGDGLLLPADQEADFAAVEPLDPDAIDVLPKWDAYTMGHAPDGRRRFVNEEHRPLAYSAGGGGTLPGDGFPLVLRGGRAVARWSHAFTGNRMEVVVTPFEPRALPKRLIEHAFDAAGELLSATSIEVTVEAPAG